MSSLTSTGQIAKLTIQTMNRGIAQQIKTINASGPIVHHIVKGEYKGLGIVLSDKIRWHVGYTYSLLVEMGEGQYAFIPYDEMTKMVVPDAPQLYIL